MIRFYRRSSVNGGLLLLAASSVAGCATLPSSGPTGVEVLRASASASLPMTLIDLDPSVVAAAERDRHAPSGLAALAAAGEVDRIGPGDVLQITIFEVGAALFAGGSGEATTETPGAAGRALPLITVDRAGQIAVPYIGRFDVGGLTINEVREQLSQGMMGLSQHAQIVVSVKQNVTNTVFVSGAVKTPGRLPLTLTRERLLDIIAEAGGPVSNPYDIQVRVTRGERNATAMLSEIAAGSAADLVLLPGDRIELLPGSRSFTVFGATDKVSEIPFQSATLTLAQAVARAGGPSDRQADPKAVFLFRLIEPVDPAEIPEARIYRLNMMRPESYFLAQRFAMRSGDVIYFANARSNQASKLVTIINQLFSPFYTARALTRD